MDGVGRLVPMVLGSLPFWLVLLLVTAPPPPSAGQLLNTALVAVFSGVIATSLFLHARHHAATSYQLAAVDATQAGEVLFSLLGEILFLQGAVPGPAGLLGLALTVAGLVLYVRVQTGKSEKQG
jgi:drug/metabolite transporter (DMT)-like permease